jgi:hypothetical protein
MYKKRIRMKMNPKALHKISYGLYIVCSKNKEKVKGHSNECPFFSPIDRFHIVSHNLAGCGIVLAGPLRHRTRVLKKVSLSRSQ